MRSSYQTQNNLDYIQIEMVKFSPKINISIVFPTVYDLSKNNLYQVIHHCFGNVSIKRPKQMARKWLMKGLPKHIPDLEYPWLICLLNKATKINRGPTVYVSNFTPGLLLQMDFEFFNVEIIYGFTSIFVYICGRVSIPGFCMQYSIEQI